MRPSLLLTSPLKPWSLGCSSTPPLALKCSHVVGLVTLCYVMATPVNISRSLLIILRSASAIPKAALINKLRLRLASAASWTRIRKICCLGRFPRLLMSRPSQSRVISRLRSTRTPHHPPSRSSHVRRYGCDNIRYRSLLPSQTYGVLKSTAYCGGGVCE